MQNPGFKPEKRPERSMEPRASSLLAVKADLYKPKELPINTTTKIITAPSPVHAAKESLAAHEEPHLGRIIFILLLVLAFGLGVGAYILIGTKHKTPVGHNGVNGLAATATPDIITSTTAHADVMLSDSPRTQILVDISLLFGKTTLQTGETRPVVFLIKDAAGNSRPATSADFLNTMGVHPVSRLLIHSLDTDITYKILPGAAPTGELLFTSRSYPNTFAAMLDWEASMAGDILQILHPELNSNDLKAVSGRTFHDERIDGVDTRMLLDPLGNTLIVYGFPNPKTLIISGDRDAFLKSTSTTAIK